MNIPIEKIKEWFERLEEGGHVNFQQVKAELSHIMTRDCHKNPWGKN